MPPINAKCPLKMVTNGNIQGTFGIDHGHLALTGDKCHWLGTNGIDWKDICHWLASSFSMFSGIKWHWLVNDICPWYTRQLDPYGRDIWHWLVNAICHWEHGGGLKPVYAKCPFSLCHLSPVIAKCSWSMPFVHDQCQMSLGHCRLSPFLGDIWHWLVAFTRFKL